MKVTIVNVSTENVAKGKSRYTKATVDYTWNGEARKQTIMSFANPQVLKDVQELIGQEVEVETGKNDAGFSEWRSVKKLGAATTATPTPAGAPATRVTGSNYETKEERAARQVLIVKQSSLSTAVESLSPGAKTKLDPKEVIAVAQEFTDWIFDKQKDESVDDMQDDIPY